MPPRLRLNGLDEAAVAELVTFVAGGKPDNELLRLADGAAGNPLYVIELVDALARGSSVTVTGAGTAGLTGASRAGFPVGGHRGPSGLRLRPGAGGAAGGGPARGGLRRA